LMFRLINIGKSFPSILQHISYSAIDAAVLFVYPKLLFIDIGFRRVL
jgi:hypothetical protein